MFDLASLDNVLFFLYLSTPHVRITTRELRWKVFTILCLYPTSVGPSAFSRSIQTKDLSKAVSCDLSVIDLDANHPPFATLSYVWNIDTEAKRDIVLCGGQALSLTRNGHDALRHLRQRLGSFTIWIDAICIDQTNQEEKSNQVRLMGSIYSKASIVYVWMGIGKNSSSRALSFMEDARFQQYFQWDLESVAIDHRQLEIHKAACAYAFGRLGRIQESSKFAQRESTTESYSCFLINHYRLRSHSRL